MLWLYLILILIFYLNYTFPRYWKIIVAAGTLANLRWKGQSDWAECFNDVYVYPLKGRNEWWQWYKCKLICKIVTLCIYIFPSSIFTFTKRVIIHLSITIRKTNLLLHLENCNQNKLITYICTVGDYLSCRMYWSLTYKQVSQWTTFSTKDVEDVLFFVGMVW